MKTLIISFSIILTACLLTIAQTFTQSSVFVLLLELLAIGMTLAWQKSEYRRERFERLAKQYLP